MFRGLRIILWVVCFSAAVVATVGAIKDPANNPILVAVFWWLVTFGSMFLDRKGRSKTPFRCMFNGHKWTMTRGFYGQPHHTAVCERCGAVPKEYNA